MIDFKRVWDDAVSMDDSLKPREDRMLLIKDDSLSGAADPVVDTYQPNELRKKPEPTDPSR